MSKVTAYLYKEDEMKILVIDDGNRELTTVVFSGQQQSFFSTKNTIPVWRFGLSTVTGEVVKKLWKVLWETLDSDYDPTVDECGVLRDWTEVINYVKKNPLSED